MIKIMVLILAGTLAYAQPIPSGGSQGDVSAKANDVRVSLCREDEDIGRLKFDLKVELKNESSGPLLIYRMQSQYAPYIAIATSLENALKGDFKLKMSGSVYLGDEDLVEEFPRDSFLELAPGQTYQLQVETQAFVPISPRPDQIRSGSYWLITDISTWPYTTVRPETLNLDSLWTKDVLLEPAQFLIMVPQTLEACSGN